MRRLKVLFTNKRRPSALVLTFTALTAAFLGLHPAQAADLGRCSPDSQPQTRCEAKLETLRPTQFAVGLIEVEAKAKKLAKKDHDDYKKYLKKHPIPVIIGNGGQFYPIDHHHLARALEMIGKSKAVIEIAQNWNALSAADFWKRMIAQHDVYLFDETGAPRTTSELPHSIADLADDPYRSLAGAVEDEGGFQKTGYFVEFVWAQFFRTRIDRDRIENHFKKAVKAALELAHSPEASSMPGYDDTAAN